MSHTDVMTGKILALARNWAEIEVEVGPGVRQNLHADTETPGFGQLFGGDVGSWVKLEVETYPAGVTSGHDNYVVVEVIGIFYPPIRFEWDGKQYEIPSRAGDVSYPIAVVLDRGTAVKIPWWKESNPPQPGEISEIKVIAAKSVVALKYVLEKEYGAGNVFAAEWIPAGARNGPDSLQGHEPGNRHSEHPPIA